MRRPLNTVQTSQKALRTFAKDNRGISAVEFAILLPVILLLLAGTVDVGQALMVDRKMNQIASAAADLVAQKASWPGSTLDALLSGTATMIEPYSNANLTILVTIINIDTSKNATVAWSRAYHTTTVAAGSAPPMPLATTITKSGVQMVVTKATYNLRTPFAAFLRPFIGISSYSYTRYGINRPRISDTITLTSG